MPEPDYKKLNNPVPQDLSLYDDTQAGQQADSLTVYNTQNVSGIEQVRLEQSTRTKADNSWDTVPRNQDGIPILTITPPKEDQGSSGQGVSPDAPENPDKVYDDAILRSLRTSSQGSRFLGTDGEINLGLPGAGQGYSKITDSKKVNSKSKPVFGADLATVNINARRNELHDFNSYTYNIALYMMDSNQYIDLTKSPRNIRQVLASSQLLMRSGGVGFQGSELFGDQFYIDDLEVNSVGLGPSKFKHNTNATNISFKVYEPRGVTLLDKLKQQASQFLRTGERYVQAPYLLEISFKGYDANGTPSTDIVTPKYIPVKITDFDFQVQDSGSVYKIDAIPYGHFTFGQITSTIPVNLEVKASTIGEIFNSVRVGKEEFQRYEYDGAEDDDGVAVYETVYGTKPVTLGEALTNHYKSQLVPPASSPTSTNKNSDTVDATQLSTEPDASLYNAYEFTIADKIANAKINHADLFEALNSPMPTDKSNNKKADESQFKAYAAGLSKQIQVDKETFVFKVNAGTDLIKLINLLVMHSTYMDDNILDDNQVSNGVTTGRPIHWFKISPFLKEFRGYDERTGNSKYTINYGVVPQVVYGHDFPWAPKSLPPGDGVHKVYNYIFTGLNEDVLKFDLRFDTTYFRTMLEKNGTPPDKPADSDFQHQIKYIPNSVEGDTTNNTPSLKRSRAKDLFSSMLADGMDLINLDLDIVGDPCYICTSEWLWQDLLNQGKNYGTAWMPDGTINFELGTPYILVNFQTPTDYDEVTGFADPNQATNSRFSGKYKVMGIESTFSGGVFQQNLSGIRLDLQESRQGTINKTGQQTSSNNRPRLEDLDAEAAAGNSVVDRITGRYKPKNNNSGAATVVDTAASEDAYNEIPQSFPLTNTRLTAEIAQGPDQSVTYIEDPDNVSATEQWLSRL